MKTLKARIQWGIYRYGNGWISPKAGPEDELVDLKRAHGLDGNSLVSSFRRRDDVVKGDRYYPRRS